MRSRGRSGGGEGPSARPSIAIRAALPSDAATIVRLIRELAAFEDLLDPVRISEADVLRDGFGERPYFEGLWSNLGMRWEAAYPR
jgi:hypothetical protein